VTQINLNTTYHKRHILFFPTFEPEGEILAVTI